MKEKNKSTEAKEEILIKKYENRRLYSANDKKYITLEDIENHIKKGRKVRIEEVTTEQDITSEVLMQILLEQRKINHLPVEILEMMIRMDDVWLGKMWAPYLETSFKMFSQMSSMTMAAMKPFLSKIGK